MNHIKNYLFLIFLFFVPGGHLFSQAVDTHILYNFSHSDSYHHSEVKHVLALDDYFLVAGQVRATEESGPTVFVAAFSYDASLLWEYALSVPAGLAGLELTTYENLKAFGAGRFVIGGTALAEISGEYVGHPFVFVFSGSGDSLHYHQYETDMHIELGAVNTDLHGDLLLGGIRKPRGLRNRMSEWEDDVLLRPNTWIGRFRQDYSSESALSVMTNLFRMSSVRNIYQIAGLPDHFVVAGYKYQESLPPIEIHLFRHSTLVYQERMYYFPHDSDFPIYPQSAIFPLYDFTAQPSRYHPFGMIWAYITGRRSTISRGPSALAFGGRRFDGPGSTTNYFYTDTFVGASSFSYNGLLKLREAWNKDMLAVKAQAFDRDSIMVPDDYHLDPIEGHSLFIRTDSAGVVKGYELIEYYPYDYDEDGAGGQILLDLDQRPDGQKIILCGFIDAHEPIPGKWETVGRMSWIVIMNDTTTSITPPGTGISRLPGDLDFTVYPNPSTDQVRLVLPGGVGGQPLSYSVVDLSGREVAAGLIESEHSEIDVSGLIAGSYYLVLRNSEGHQTARIFIKN